MTLAFPERFIRVTVTDSPRVFSDTPNPTKRAQMKKCIIVYRKATNVSCDSKKYEVKRSEKQNIGKTSSSVMAALVHSSVTASILRTQFVSPVSFCLPNFEFFFIFLFFRSAQLLALESGGKKRKLSYYDFFIVNGVNRNCQYRQTARASNGRTSQGVPCGVACASLAGSLRSLTEQ